MACKRPLVCWAAALLLFSWASYATELPYHLPVPGGVALVDAGPAELPRPSVRFNNRPILTAQKDERWWAVVGIPLTMEAGQYNVLVNNKPVPLTIQPKSYPIRRLRIANTKTVTPNAEVQAQIDADAAAIAAAQSHWDPQQPTSLRMLLPVRGRITSDFGKTSYYNNDKRPRRHEGIDVGGRTGTRMRAAQAGKVVNASEFVIYGGTVIIDHGQGLLTMYCHMSRIDVQVGDEVTRGQTIGAVGASGRVTGPHLHWSVGLNHSWVEPRQFIGPEKAALQLLPSRGPMQLPVAKPASQNLLLSTNPLSTIPLSTNE